MSEKNSNMSDYVNKMRSLINKGSGVKFAYNLNEDNPTKVKDWVSTGCRVLDSVICEGKVAGIPMGKISEIAGEEGSGKSYLALQIALNALSKGILPVYFDSESAIDPEFIVKMGYNLDDFLYVQAPTCEKVMDMIEKMMAESERPILFIWDSLAQTPTERQNKVEFDPLALIGDKARVMAHGLQKLVVPLANHGSGLLILNQLKTNISTDPTAKYTDPYSTPGGKAPAYSYSLRIWLHLRKAKGSYILDESEEIIGTEIKAKIKKSRFGSFGRQISFKILWGGSKITVQEEEMWLEIIKSSSSLHSSGSWCTMKYEDGTEEKFQSTKFVEKLKVEKFHDRVLELLDEVLIKRIRANEDEQKD